MSKLPIKNIFARQILDSRGFPAVEVTVEAGKFKGVFGVPSGASTGKAEALEMLDGGPEFFGKGVSKAVNNVNEVIAKRLKGQNVFDQAKIDQILIELDGTKNKSRYGANAILGVSGAACKVAAAAKKQPLYKYIGSLHKTKKFHIPRFLMVFIEGGLHGDTNLNLQEYWIIPNKKTAWQSLRLASEVFHNLGKILKARRLFINVGNEGAYSPHVESNRQALDFLAEAIKQSGYTLGVDVNLGLDPAASEFYKPEEKNYVLSADNTALTSERMVSMFKEWVEAYHIIILEDPLAEEDWEGWQAMQGRLSEKIVLVGDDLFATQVDRLQKGIEKNVGTGIIIKPNQVGTISETLATVALAQKHNYKIVVSHRAGETNDTFIADLAVGVGADFIKTGSVARGERVAKYNRLMEIEQELK